MDIEKISRPEPKQKIPPEAKKVFEGAMFDAYQWEQEMFDGSHATFERLRRPDTAVIIPVTTEGKIILLEQEQPGREPFIDFPSGRLNLGENPKDAAARELLEETGYAPENLSLWYAFQPLSKIDWAIYVFVAQKCEKVANQNLDSGEKIGLKFISLEELLEMTEKEEFLKDELGIKLLRAKYNKAKMSELKNILGLN